MKFKQYIKSILNENPVPPTKQLDQFDYGQDGHETVLLTPEAPKYLRDLAGDDQEVVLVSINPYKIKLKDGSDELYSVFPKDIVIENNIKNKVVEYTKQYLKYIKGRWKGDIRWMLQRLKK